MAQTREGPRDETYRWVQLNRPALRTPGDPTPANRHRDVKRCAFSSLCIDHVELRCGDVVPITEDVITKGDIHSDASLITALDIIEGHAIAGLIRAIDDEHCGVHFRRELLEDTYRATDGDAIKGEHTLGIGGDALPQESLGPVGVKSHALQAVVMAVLEELLPLVTSRAGRLVDRNPASLVVVVAVSTTELGDVVPIANDVSIRRHLDFGAIGGHVHGNVLAYVLGQ